MKITQLILVMVMFAYNSLGSAQTVTTITPIFSASGDIAVAPNGDIFVADFGTLISAATGTTVYRVTPDGVVTPFATGLQGASGNEIGPDGLLYQSSIAGNRVSRIDANGNVTDVADINDGLVAPVGLTFDSQGNLYVANCGANRISKIDASGNVTTLISSFSLACPNGLTSDADDNLYVANFNNGDIVKVDLEGNEEVFASTPGSPSKPNGGNGHITFANGQLYVVSNATHQVFSITLEGQLEVLAGSGERGRNDVVGLEASFSLPNGIGVSPDGKTIYVNDTVGLTSRRTIGPNVVRAIQLPDEPISIAPNDGMTGSWFRPGTSGQGLLIDINTELALFFAGWFTFDDAVEGSQRWLTVQGELTEDNRISAGIFETSGGVFNGNSEVTTQRVGDFSIEFLDCATAQAEYSFNDDSNNTSMELQRLTPDSFCRQAAQNRR